tara:strand:- start:722 stop:1105 length:384 start_codon:yes stop_codon:yes gene_type:complete
MLINTPVSLGELVDKISILIIKKRNILNKDKLAQVNKELDILKKILHQNVKKNEIDNYLNDLIDINSKLWIIEDDIRECEKDKQFDQKFIDLARNVYFTNDKRANIKLIINKKFGSELVEVKSYEAY